MQAQKRVTVSSKGQIVIPKELRKDMNINKGDELRVEEAEDGIFLRPSPRGKAEHKSKLRGFLKGEDFDLAECEAILEEAKKTLDSHLLT